MTIDGRETSIDINPDYHSMKFYRVPFIDWFLAPFSDDFSLSFIGLPKELGAETRSIQVNTIYKDRMTEH